MDLQDLTAQTFSEQEALETCLRKSLIIWLKELLAALVSVCCYSTHKSFIGNAFRAVHLESCARLISEAQRLVLILQMHL